MTRPYQSFTIRSWQLDAGAHRFKVECVQTGEVARLSTLTEVFAWIAHRHTAEAGDQDTERDRRGRATMAARRYVIAGHAVSSN